MVVAAAAACNSSMAPAPSPPPPAPNTPPAIQSVTVDRERVDAGEDVEVTAVVEDAETALDQLTYTWTASPAAGTFVGSGRQVVWRAPGGQATPDTYTLTLTVTERYQSAGGPAEHRVSSGATIHYNDSPAEVGAIAAAFIKDFGTFEVTPEECVRYFSDTCSGKMDELRDIEWNRANVHIHSSEFSVSEVTFDQTMTSGTVSGPCTFEDTPNGGAQRIRTSGTCFMTTVYESGKWFLCSSNFLNGTSVPARIGRYRHRVP
jgi:hypothetical protein